MARFGEVADERPAEAAGRSCGVHKERVAAAIARGGLPSCTRIELFDNPGSAAPVKGAAERRGGMKVI